MNPEAIQFKWFLLKSSSVKIMNVCTVGLLKQAPYIWNLKILDKNWDQRHNPRLYFRESSFILGINRWYHCYRISESCQYVTINATVMLKQLPLFLVNKWNREEFPLGRVFNILKVHLLDDFIGILIK